jgi:hypothetical protein
MLALLAAAAVMAQTQNTYLDEGKRLFNELKYADAIVQLQVARQVPGLSDAQTVEVLDLLARSQVAEGRRADAEKSYGDLLLLAPSFTPDRSLSPKILEAFDAAKARVFPKDYFKLEPIASAPGIARLRIIDPWNRAGAFELDSRLEGDPAWQLDTVTAQDGVLTLKLEAPPLRTLEWYVVARNAAGGDIVGGFGTSHEPQRLAVPLVNAAQTPIVTTTSTPRLQRPFGWILAAAAVAAAGVGALFQVFSLNESTLAHDRTRTQYAVDARTLQSAAVRDASIATACFIGAGVFAVGGTLVFVW